VAISKADRYFAARPAEYPTLATIQLVQHLSADHVPSLDVVLELAHRRDPSRVLRVRFIGVLNLCLRQPNWSLFDLAPLEINDVSSDQCEGIRFRVRESENDALSLLCADIDIELGERT
jgi:hypothetical protein